MKELTLKQQIIIDILKSMNMGNVSYSIDRVYEAIKQYEKLVERGILPEEEEAE
jgi:hypothetical protein